MGVIIVSNRLPVSVRRAGNGSLEFYPSVGGLATGLSSFIKDPKNVWIGWPGMPSEELDQNDTQKIIRELKKHHCHPVFLSRRQLEDYYNGFSNRLLWPLMHDAKPDLSNHDKRFRSYTLVNQLFADETIKLSKTSTRIWVHDYHLLLLPRLLRESLPKVKIGFFLHIPFPSFRSLKTVPSHRDLVDGILGADLVGFQTSANVRNFLDVCEKSGTGTVINNQVILGSRIINVSSFPISIDYAKFFRASRKLTVQKEIRQLKKEFGDQKIILTVDRLEPTKGLPERLEAYKNFLANSPKAIGKVMMVMLAVPSRTDIEEYRQLRVRLEKLINSINDKFGEGNWQPIKSLFTNLPFEKLVALYSVADIAFIAPVRDGMNLVAKEYVASKSRRDGVLILSSTAGAAEELEQALIVDPAKQSSLVSALKQAFSMQKSEAVRRLNDMQAYVKTHTVYNWADSFMNVLEQPVPGFKHYSRKLTPSRKKTLVSDYKKAKHRLFLLDYDGVLAEFQNNFASAKPTERLVALLKKLGSNESNKVVIISGRSTDNLTNWFGHLPVELAAEHAMLIRPKGSEKWQATFASDTSWQARFLPLLKKFAAVTPGAEVEVKRFSLVWHYRGATPYLAQKHLYVLRSALKPLLKEDRLEMLSGNKVLEIRPEGSSKGRGAIFWLNDEVDFILAAGDDFTDEDMFAVLPPSAYTIKIGRGRTLARFRLQSVNQAIDLLGKLVSIK